jgi:Tfp pilus assembly protein PilE
MGQQQLLLVILVTIIVGIATVVAINTFSSAADSANLDAVRQDLALIASSAQAYYVKPTMLGGGGSSFAGINFNLITFPSDSLDEAGLKAINANGSYTIDAGAGDADFTVIAVPESGVVENITATIVADGMTMVTND